MRGKTESCQQFMDTGEAAAFLKIKRATLYDWIRDTRGFALPVRRHGRRVVFKPEELVRWSDERNARSQR